MAKFTDSLGREWKLEIHRGHLAALREAGLDLNKARTDLDVLAALEDLDTFGRVFWILCEEQAHTRKIEPEDFARGFDGPTGFAASDAFLAAFLTFSLRPKVAAAAIERLPAMTEDLERQAIERIVGGSGGRIPPSNCGWSGSAASSPASSESAPPG